MNFIKLLYKKVVDNDISEMAAQLAYFLSPFLISIAHFYGYLTSLYSVDARGYFQCDPGFCSG